MKSILLGKFENKLIGIAGLFYLVGIVGMFTDYRSFFLSLTPYHLLLNFLLFLLARSKWDLRFLSDVLLIGLIALLAEWIGVHTGFLFGTYQYGSNLGVQLDGVPLIIGLNWVMLTFSAASLVKQFNLSGWGQIISATAVMVGLDWLMESVAGKSDYWHWTNGAVPIYNYVCWFGVALFFQWWIERRKTAVSNKVWASLFVMMTLFFAILR